jgi:hypothetical protein
MERRFSVHPVMATLCVVLSVIAASVGMTCPLDDSLAPFDPPVAPGDKAPRILITRVDTPLGGSSVDVGDMVVIAFDGDSGDLNQTASVSIFASTSPNPSLDDPTTIPIPIAGGNNVIGPGTGSGEGTWDTTGVAIANYNVFAEIDDGVNPPVRVISQNPVSVLPKGTQPIGNPPDLVFITPRVTLGLLANSEVAVRYIYVDTDSSVTVTLMLDEDLDPTNDSLQPPVILPSESRLVTDPTFDGDPPPPDDAANPPTQPDSVQIRTNPRFLPQTPQPVLFPFPTAPIAGELQEYRFVIDFSRIPPNPEPVFLRADITDGDTLVHRYSTAAITISRATSGDNGTTDTQGRPVVDVDDIGFELAGVRFQGFGSFESLGTDFVAAGDLDNDGLDEAMIASRYATVRSRNQAGAAYLIFGRPKALYPADTDGDGIPDSGDLDGDGNIDSSFPAPPDFVEDPYGPENVGRLGGAVSIEDVGITFRGAIYAMPTARPAFNIFGMPLPQLPVPQDDLIDPRRAASDQLTAGLTSITRFDLNQDGTPDFVFGLPYVSNAYDHMDDDPANGSCEQGLYVDNLGFLPNPGPNDDRCDTEADDDLSRTPIEQGLVIGVDGTADLNTLANFLDAGVAGQFDPENEKPTDDEGVILTDDEIPNGMRFRGAWFSSAEPFEPEVSFSFLSTSEFGRTVASVTRPNGRQDLLISVPGIPGDLGSIQVWPSNDFFGTNFYQQPVLSLPGIRVPDDMQGACTDPPDGDTGDFETACRRETVNPPVSAAIFGSQFGDQLGFADSAGNFNGFGAEDIVAGAPGHDVLDGSGAVITARAGQVHVLLAPVGGFGGDSTIDDFVANGNILTITGTHDDDQFGLVQTSIGDGIRGVSFNGDSTPDVAFAAESFDANVDGIPGEEADVGFVGVIFGRPPRLGAFGPEDVGLANQLPGVRFYGATAGARAGHDVSSAGDFNGDGKTDLLITSPGEVRTINGQPRFGVCYLIFGGTHLRNKSFNLSQVGVQDANGIVQLPGIVFVSRSLLPGPNPANDTRAELETVGRVGDMDGDGFEDIMIGAPNADFVNVDAPGQRIRDAGEAYLVYGNNFGSNNANTFPAP